MRTKFLAGMPRLPVSRNASGFEKQEVPSRWTGPGPQLSPRSRCLPQQDRHTRVLLRGPSVSKPPAFLPLPPEIGRPETGGASAGGPACLLPFCSQPGPRPDPDSVSQPWDPTCTAHSGVLCKAGRRPGRATPAAEDAESHRSPQPHQASFTGEGEKAPAVLA